MDSNSLEAYRSIVESLGPRQQIVFEALRNNPATNKTLAKRLGLEINQVTPRTLELRKKGLVKKCIQKNKTGITLQFGGYHYEL